MAALPQTDTDWYNKSASSQTEEVLEKTKLRDKKNSSRIEDNPSAKMISDVLSLVKMTKLFTSFAKKLGITNKSFDRIQQAADDVLQQSDVLTLPDRFNDAFAPKGWIATGSMSADTMGMALELYEAGKNQQAEDAIIAWFQENTINLFAIVRAKKFNKAGNRWHQLREALKLTFEERYWSAVPLILIACDGFASDVLGTSPFEKDADLTAFDSITGHPNSLPFLIGELTKGVRKSSDEELTLPLRHGILHGQSLGYANRIVCMKAWLLMIALVDWACDKSNEEERIRERQSVADVSFRDLAERIRKTKADKRAMEAFEPRESLGPFTGSVDGDSPEFAIIDFLTCWKDRNYGRMAERAVNLMQHSITKIAGQLRRDAEFIELTDFEIRSVQQSAVARADAVAFLKGSTPNGDVEGEFQVVAFRHTTEGDIAMPTDPGRWFVQQACIFDLMHGRTSEAKRKQQD